MRKIRQLNIRKVEIKTGMEPTLSVRNRTTPHLEKCGKLTKESQKSGITQVSLP